MKPISSSDSTSSASTTRYFAATRMQICRRFPPSTCWPPSTNGWVIALRSATWPKKLSGRARAPTACNHWPGGRKVAWTRSSDTAGRTSQLLVDLLRHASEHGHLCFRTKRGDRVRLPAAWQIPELVERAHARPAEAANEADRLRRRTHSQRKRSSGAADRAPAPRTNG